jgi:hypothetical protein
MHNVEKMSSPVLYKKFKSIKRSISNLEKIRFKPHNDKTQNKNMQQKNKVRNGSLVFTKGKSPKNKGSGFNALMALGALKKIPAPVLLNRSNEAKQQFSIETGRRPNLRYKAV